MLALAQESGDEALLALPTSVIGRALAVLGEYEKATPMLERAAPILERSGNWREWPGAEGFLGVARGARGDYRAGRAHAERVLARGIESGDTVGATVGHVLLACVLLNGGELERAVQEAAATARQAERADERVYVYVGLGFQALAECRLGRLEAAAADFARSKAVGASLGGRLFLAEFMRAAEAELLLAQGRAVEAKALAEETIRIAQEAHNRLALGMAHRVLAGAIAAVDPARFSEAEQQFALSVAVLLGGGGRVEAARTKAQWGALLLARGDVQAGRARLLEAAEVFESSEMDEELSRLPR